MLNERKANERDMADSALRMKTLKGADFEKRLRSQEEVEKLLSELKACQFKEGLTADQILDYRTVCDRILRACNQRVAECKSSNAHFQSLLVLAEQACRGYTAAVAQRTPLYLEKILFHFLKNVVAHGAYDGCAKFADLLYNLLASSSSLSGQQEKDYQAIAKSCFSVLWKAAEGVTKSAQWTPLESRTALCCRLHAIRYLVLLEAKSLAPSPGELSSTISLAGRHTAAAATIFETQRCPVTRDDMLFLSDNILSLLIKSLVEGIGTQGPLNEQQATCLLELTLEQCRRLCKNDCFWEAAESIRKSQEYLARVGPEPALELCRLGVELHTSASVGDLLLQAIGVIRRFIEVGNEPSQVLTDCCQFVISAVDKHIKKTEGSGFVLQDVLSLSSYLEQHCQLLHKQMTRVPPDGQKQLRSLKVQFYSCCQLYTTVVCNFFQDFQVGKAATLGELLKTCVNVVTRMLQEVDGLSEQDEVEFLSLTGSCAFNLAYRFYNLKMYRESSEVMAVLCKKLGKGVPSGKSDLPSEKLHKFFRLQVESYRKASVFKQAFCSVALWLIALKGEILEQMEDPISLWVRVKMDAVKSGHEDMRLKTIKDCLADSDVETLEPRTLSLLLSQELRAYKAVHADTGQERYNVICDLLDICSEESKFVHERAVNLVELAQVLCYHDYTGQTDCTALDSVQEALRLLDTVHAMPANTDQLMDDKAQALLWLYICTIEAKMQESMDIERRVGSTNAQIQRNLQKFEPNDLNYEDRLQEEKFAYDGINFNLVADSDQSKCLDEALSLWKKVLSSQHVPKVRCTEQTIASLQILGALYKLIGKPLKSIECYLLLRRLSNALEDCLATVNVLCHLSKILFLLGCPSYAKIYIEEAEACLSRSDCSSDIYLLMKLTCEGLRCQLCCAVGKVKEGVTLLLGILKHPSLHKSSKAWYLLRAHILQLLASYLQLPSSSLSSELRQQLWEQGWRTPETALTDAHKLLRSIILLLLGNAVFTPKVNAEYQFVDHGDNLLQKWQVLGDLLSCSHALVALLSCVGSVSEAKAFCLEALKVSIKLQAVRQCAEFLVTKADLELQRTELELCQLDLQQVLFLLESGTAFRSNEQQDKIKIKLKKRKAISKELTAGHVGSSEEEGFLKYCALEFVDVATVDKEGALSSSPVLKSKQKKHPSFLSHPNNCTCSLCSDLSLSVLCTRWAMTFAEMQVAFGNHCDGSSLLRAALQRCVCFSSRFSNVLCRFLSQDPRDSSQKDIKGLSTVRLADRLLAQIYTSLASLNSGAKHHRMISMYIQAGLSFISSNGVYGLEHCKANLLLAKAVTSLCNLASGNGDPVADIFSPLWIWNPPTSCSFATEKKSIKTTDMKISWNEAVQAVKGEKAVLSANRKRKGSTAKEHVVPLSVNVKDAFSLDDSDTEVPTIVIKSTSAVNTPVQKYFPAALQPKTSFTVFNEESLPADKHLARAPKASRKMKSRLKVVFSDESDPEALDKEEKEKISKTNLPFPVDKKEKTVTYSRTRTKKNSTDRSRVEENSQSNSGRCQRKGRPGNKETDPIAGEKETLTAAKRVTRGRAHLLQDEVEVLRAIQEETEDVFDISFEVLRGSDGEDKPATGRLKRTTTMQDGADGECEVLRRDASSDLQNWLPGEDEKGVDQNPFSMQDLSSSLHSAISASDVDEIYSTMKDAFHCVDHYPPSVLYAQLCQLMALCLGNSDPYTTAYLVSESVAVTTRHQLISNIHRKLRKKKKDLTLDVSDQLQDLTLQDASADDLLTQHLTQLENLFQFSCSGLMKNNFYQQLQQIPNDVVVCVLTMLDPHLGVTGDTLLITRLEGGHTPITVRIPTAQGKVSLSSALREFDAIQKEQKEISNLTDKVEWWEGRSALDRRMKLLIESMEHHVLGCWKGLLLPSCLESDVVEEACCLAKTLEACGLVNNDAVGLLKAILSGSHILSCQNVKSLALGLCHVQPDHALTLLQTSVDKLKTITGKSSGHLVLVLDKNLQKLPWESLPSLISRTVTRLPSLRFLLSYDLIKKYRPQSAFTKGVNPDSTYYVLNPHANLPGTEERFRDWFHSESKWSGVTGKAPTPEQVQAALTQHDLYIYAGHGAGAYFLDGQSLIRLDCSAVSLLFGCSSAALAVRGKLEGAGIILKYLMAGCPLVLGNLWDVTDRDIDRYMEAFLRGWIKAGSGAPMLPYITQARQAPKLKYLIGAAPIAYGMPVALQ
ncbi:hypothetical protein NDU88_000440 [Pleurodeles waltl]|uniref:separase n=1 Tax=Pleurodeles waltl TaxID=8319 RepID=A0AAV7S4L1_PLEWA|nr:hypothetical protein NDU88_000440 [Pleurodeles waltl]